VMEIVLRIPVNVVIKELIAASAKPIAKRLRGCSLQPGKKVRVLLLFWVDGYRFPNSQNSGFEYNYV
jgi:hypothetical protein